MSFFSHVSGTAISTGTASIGTKSTIGLSHTEEGKADDKPSQINKVRAATDGPMSFVKDIAGKISKLPENLSTALASATPSSTFLSAQGSLPSTNATDFNYRSLQIMKRECDEELQKELGEKASLEDLLRAIELVFSKIFEKGLEKQQSQDYSMVIGDTGVGKSALIGNLIGAKIVSKKIELPAINRPKRSITKLVADYAEENIDKYPKIGHSNSQTRAVGIYGKYIDTAGFKDTGGPAINLCNTIATYMAARIYEPSRFIVVIKPAVLDDCRGQGLIKMLEEIQTFVDEPINENTLSSILFVVNDFLRINQRNGQPTDNKQQSISNQLANAIDTLIRERNEGLARANKDSDQVEEIFNKIEEIQTELQIIEKNKESDNPDEALERCEVIFLSKKAQGIKKFTKILKQLKKIQGELKKVKTFEEIKQRFKKIEKNFLEQLTPQIVKYQKDITFLEKIYELENVIEIDIFADNCRSAIENYFKKHSFSPPLTFTTHQGISIQKFKVCLLEIISYFNTLYNDKEEYEKKLDEKIEQIALAEKLIDAIVRQADPNPTAEALSAKEESQSIIQKQIQAIEQKLANCKSQIEDKKKEQDDLSKDEKIVPWKSLNPKVYPRSFWDIFGIWSYPFKHNETTPIHEVKLYPAIGTKDAGSFKVNNNETNLDKGKYEAVYIPAWFNYQKDKKAEIKFYVKSNHHPETIKKIKEFTSDIKKLEEEEKQLNDQLKNLNNNKVTLEKANADLKTLVNEQQEILALLIDIKLILCVYDKVCLLIGKIICQLKFDSTEISSFLVNETQKEKFIKFLSNIKGVKNNEGLLENLSKSNQMQNANQEATLNEAEIDSFLSSLSSTTSRDIRPQAYEYGGKRYIVKTTAGGGACLLHALLGKEVSGVVWFIKNPESSSPSPTELHQNAKQAYLTKLTELLKNTSSNEISSEVREILCSFFVDLLTTTSLKAEARAIFQQGEIRKDFEKWQIDKKGLATKIQNCRIERANLVFNYFEKHSNKLKGFIKIIREANKEKTDWQQQDDESVLREIKSDKSKFIDGCFNELYEKVERDAQKQIGAIDDSYNELIEKENSFYKEKIQENFPVIFSLYETAILAPEFYMEIQELKIASILFQKRVVLFNTTTTDPILVNMQPGEEPEVVIFHEGAHFSRCEQLIEDSET